MNDSAATIAVMVASFRRVMRRSNFLRTTPLWIVYLPFVESGACQRYTKSTNGVPGTFRDRDSCEEVEIRRPILIVGPGLKDLLAGELSRPASVRCVSLDTPGLSSEDVWDNTLQAFHVLNVFVSQLCSQEFLLGANAIAVVYA